jgi:hypothetical protein
MGDIVNILAPNTRFGHVAPHRLYANTMPSSH